MVWYSHLMKILQARLEQYMNQECPDIQAGFRKGRGIRDQIANTHQIIEKAREFYKNIYFFFIDYAEAFACVDHNKLWKMIKDMSWVFTGKTDVEDETPILQPLHAKS